MQKTKRQLLEEARQLVDESPIEDIQFVGKKPWTNRLVSKLKLGMFLGISSGIVSGLSGFGVVDLNKAVDINNLTSLLPGNQFEEKAPEIKTINTAEIQIDKKTESKAEAPIEQTEDSLSKLHKDYPNVDFDKIKNTRDVSKQFLGYNNFLALASEMEGFRGDLHKDPAVGLNIGFGYNITKRVQESKGEVVKDLLSLGLDNEKVHRIIDMSQAPQDKLTKEIKQFNNDYKIKNNQLISLEQGVALLRRTQTDYEDQARRSFSNSFDKMDKHQQEVLTYAAYKAGYEALSKYKKAIKAADNVYDKPKSPTMNDFKSIAKEIKFYYKKDGKEWVLDERAALISHTFVHQDYLAVQIGKTDKLSNNSAKLYANKIDFSDVPLTLASKSDTKKNVEDVLSKMRLTQSQDNNPKPF